MSLPYIPGWWDEIGKSATSLVSQLPQMIQPDRVANKRLQEMVQQNPMLLEQFSNMDEGTRNMLAQSLGFKNENPIAALPVGAQRQERERITKTRAELMKDPNNAAEMNAKEFGLLRPAERMQEGLTLKKTQQEIGQNDLLNEINTFKVKDIKRTQTMIDEAVKQFPDLAKVDYKARVRDFVRQGKPINAMLALATEQNPGAAAVMDLAVKVELQKLEAEQRAALARAKDPNTKTMYLRTLTELGNQFNDQEGKLVQQRTAAEQMLQKDNRYRLMGIQAQSDPAAKAALQTMEQQAFGDLDKQITAVREAAVENSRRLNAMSEQVGKEEGIVPKQETPEQRKARLRKAAGF